MHSGLRRHHQDVSARADSPTIRTLLLAVCPELHPVPSVHVHIRSASNCSFRPVPSDVRTGRVPAVQTPDCGGSVLRTFSLCIPL